MVIRIDSLPALAARPRDGHKGTFGTVLVVAGSQGMLGAAILTSRGALRGGAGLVRTALPAELMAPFTVAVPAATTLDRDTEPLAGAIAAVEAVVCGPGLGTSAASRALLDAVLDASGEVPTVLDADALNLLAPLSSTLRAGVVLTPHPGEAGRLLSTDAGAVQGDREASALELARKSGGVVVLKGAGTVVTDGDRIYRNDTGNPGLATGGSGDVLSGLVGALLAQGLAPFDAACLGVHVHGAAGDLVAGRLSEAGMCAEDLPLAIAEVLGR